jgi:hypothetical protein
VLICVLPRCGGAGNLASLRRLSIAAIRPIGATMDGRCAIDGKFSVPHDSGARISFVRLNRSFILFVKASSTVPA